MNATAMTNASIPDYVMLNFLLLLLIPALTDLVTNAKAAAGVKSFISAILSAVAGVLSPYLTAPGHHVPWHAAILSVMQILLGSGLSHLTILKPLGITGVSGVINTHFFSGGIGKEVLQVVEGALKNPAPTVVTNTVSAPVAAPAIPAPAASTTVVLGQLPDATVSTAPLVTGTAASVDVQAEVPAPAVVPDVVATATDGLSTTADVAATVTDSLGTLVAPPTS